MFFHRQRTLIISGSFFVSQGLLPYFCSLKKGTEKTQKKLKHKQYGRY